MFECGLNCAASTGQSVSHHVGGWFSSFLLCRFAKALANAKLALRLNDAETPVLAVHVKHAAPCAPHLAWGRKRTCDPLKTYLNNARAMVLRRLARSCSGVTRETRLNGSHLSRSLHTLSIVSLDEVRSACAGVQTRVGDPCSVALSRHESSTQHSPV
eukprot:6188344-Pleurochrysis_carterae.AAC.2